MDNRHSINVALTRELELFVQQGVATGRYQTASEVVREGLRLLERQERDREAAFESLKTRLRRGAAEADRGELFPADSILKDIETLKASRDAKNV